MQTMEASWMAFSRREKHVAKAYQSYSWRWTREQSDFFLPLLAGMTEANSKVERGATPEQGFRPSSCSLIDRSKRLPSSQWSQESPKGGAICSKVSR